MAMGSNNNRSVVADINVTPLVDVMLVLLVIFMVTAPMMQQGMQVNLPKTESKSMTQAEETVIVTVNQKGKIFIDKTEISANELQPKLIDLFVSRTNKEIFLKADAGVSYGNVPRAIADIKGAGIENLGMITEPVK